MALVAPLSVALSAIESAGPAELSVGRFIIDFGNARAREREREREREKGGKKRGKKATGKEDSKMNSLRINERRYSSPPPPPSPSLPPLSPPFVGKTAGKMKNLAGQPRRLSSGSGD